MPYSHIIWDWNGTLLNDTFWCIAQMNKMLVKRKLKPFASISDYHKVFRFPIAEYYRDVGFDFAEESFEILAQEYIELYHGEGSSNLKLHDGSENVLKAILEKQITQIILSASDRQNLHTQLAPFEISQYFDELLGISDIYGKSKIEIGLDYLKRNDVTKGLMIGDTVHDFEVSRAMGIDCTLVAHGHQSKEALLKCGAPVFGGLAEVLEFILT